MSVDVCIVGQGLAGSLLAWELLQRGVRVQISDDGHASSASMASGALINPLAGQRLAMPAGQAVMLERAAISYQQLQAELALPIYRPLPILKRLRDAREQTFLQQRLADAAYQPYLAEVLAASEQAPYGSVRIQGAAHIDAQVLLSALRQRWQAQGLLQPQPTTAAITVLCLGGQIRQQRLFHWLPVFLAKGEIQTWRSEHALAPQVINAGHWLLPLADGYQFKLGASFEHGDHSLAPSEAGRLELERARQQLHPTPATLLERRVGLRAVTRDRTPILGPHPQQPQYYVFTALAARGALYAAHYAWLLAEHLTTGSTIPASASIQRYYAHTPIN